MKKAINNQGENKFEQLLGLYLKRHSSTRHEHSAKHLDEDYLTTFVEGRLTKRNNLPVISHLIKCSLCRRSAYELLQLNEQLHEDFEIITALQAETSPYHDFWNDLKVKVFNSGNNTVFAHQESDEAEDQLEESKDNDLS